MDWIHLAQDRDKWQAFVKTVTKVGSHGMRQFLDCLRKCQVFVKAFVMWI